MKILVQKAHAEINTRILGTAYEFVKDQPVEVDDGHVDYLTKMVIKNQHKNNVAIIVEQGSDDDAYWDTIVNAEELHETLIVDGDDLEYTLQNDYPAPPAIYGDDGDYLLVAELGDDVTLDDVQVLWDRANKKLLFDAVPISNLTVTEGRYHFIPFLPK